MHLFPGGQYKRIHNARYATELVPVIPAFLHDPDSAGFSTAVVLLKFARQACYGKEPGDSPECETDAHQVSMSG
jgi:hypothetical protein